MIPVFRAKTVSPAVESALVAAMRRDPASNGPTRFPEHLGAQLAAKARSRGMTERVLAEMQPGRAYHSRDLADALRYPLNSVSSALVRLYCAGALVRLGRKGKHVLYARPHQSGKAVAQNEDAA